jgi:release factor glutamine methyltransferase
MNELEELGSIGLSRPAKRWVKIRCHELAKATGTSAGEIMKSMVSRLKAGEPLQYVLGSWSFRGHDLLVDSRALIPRPETEWLVELVVRGIDGPSPRILELGTGSGAIALALLKEVSGTTVVATDLSVDALDLARENLAGFGDRVEFRAGSWFDPIAEGEVFDVIVSNPPYVCEQELHDLPPEVRNYEPFLALSGGTDGLDAYREIVPQAFSHLKENALLALEVADTRASEVSELARLRGYRHVRVERDLAGRDRFVLCRK